MVVARSPSVVGIGQHWLRPSVANQWHGEVWAWAWHVVRRASVRGHWTALVATFGREPVARGGASSGTGVMRVPGRLS